MANALIGGSSKTLSLSHLMSTIDMSYHLSQGMKCIYKLLKQDVEQDN